MGHLRPLARIALFMLLLAAATFTAETSFAKGGSDKTDSSTQVHRVSKGQTLSGIARRYGVSVSAIERANALRPGRPIQPGQKLSIPSTAKKPASAHPTAAVASQPATKQMPSKSASSDEPTKQAAKKQAVADAKPSTQVSRLEAPPSQEKQPKTTRTKEKPAPILAVTAPKLKNPADAWKAFRKPAEKPGYVVLHGTAGSYSGFAIIQNDRLSPKAYLAIRRVLASWRTGRQVDISERLIRLMVKASDTFGGRPLRIVGGYREHSYFQDSKHPLGHAVDFAVEGVPNTALRDFLRTQPRVGVGFYPNSSFVHLDVRNRSAYWVDFAGPGQPPRYRTPAPVNPAPVDPAPVNPAPVNPNVVPFVVESPRAPASKPVTLAFLAL